MAQDAYVSRALMCGVVVIAICCCPMGCDFHSSLVVII